MEIDDKPCDGASQLLTAAVRAAEQPTNGAAAVDELPGMSQMQNVPSQPVPAVYEPAPPGRSKKRRNTAVQPAPEEMVRLGEQVDRTSERLRRGVRPVRLSAEDKAPQIALDVAHMAASSSKGYRLVRATHGTHRGTWLYEVHITHLGASGAVRLGWATREAELQAPVGCDVHGYGYRSIGGSKVHAGLREGYGREYREGDVVGCMLHLPPGGRPIEKAPEDIVKYKGRLYFTEDEEPQEPRALPGSFIAFWVNGECQGKAYVDVLEGTYYPAVSLFTHPHQAQLASAAVNFGKQPFTSAAPRPEGWPLPQPISELAAVRRVVSNGIA